MKNNLLVIVIKRKYAACKFNGVSAAQGEPGSKNDPDVGIKIIFDGRSQAELSARGGRVESGRFPLKRVLPDQAPTISIAKAQCCVKFTSIAESIWKF